LCHLKRLSLLQNAKTNVLIEETGKDGIIAPLELIRVYAVPQEAGILCALIILKNEYIAARIFQTPMLN
jgi:hypothetical protein